MELFGKDKGLGLIGGAESLEVAGGSQLALSAFCLWIRLQALSYCYHACCHAAHRHDSELEPSGTISLKKLFDKLPWSWYLFKQ